MFSFSLMMLSHALKKSRAYGSMLDFSRLENGSTTAGVAGPFFQDVKPPMKTCESTGSNQKKKRLQHSRITTAQIIFSKMGETNESLTRKSAAWSDLISDPPILHFHYNKYSFLDVSCSFIKKYIQVLKERVQEDCAETGRTVQDCARNISNGAHGRIIGAHGSALSGAAPAQLRSKPNSRLY